MKSFWMRWGGSFLIDNWTTWHMPGTNINYAREVGDGRGSSIVMSIVGWIARTSIEAPVQVVEELTDGGVEVQPGHEMEQLVNRPNPYYSGILLRFATAADRAMSGNAYWLKVRSRSERVVELWWAPSWTMEPKWEDEAAFISHYEYRPGGNQTIRVEVKDVVHFRDGIDANNPRKGPSKLRSLYKELATDEEAATFTAVMMKNFGVPGVVISPKEASAKVSQEVAEETEAKFNSKFGGDKRGSTLVMKGPTDVKVLSFSPEQMTLRDLRRIPEERATAVFGVSAMVVGLGAGLDRSTFTNFGEAREAAVESTIVPAYTMMAADLDAQLLPDFDSNKRHRVRFDVSQMRALQPDQEKLSQRTTREVLSGVLRVDHAQRRLGLTVDPSRRIYLQPVNVVPVSESGDVIQARSRSDRIRMIGTKSGGYPLALALLRAHLTAAHAGAIRSFFEGQAKRALARMPAVAARSGNGSGSKASPPISGRELVTADEDGLLASALRPLWTAGISEGWTLTGESFGLSEPFSDDDANVTAALARGEERARHINDGTRQAIDEHLVIGLERSYTLRQMIDGVEDDDYAGLGAVVESHYAGRPETVAVTEAMWSTNMGAGALYQTSGVREVELLDGTGDAVCAERNGSVVSTERGLDISGQEHPNGTLSMAPA